MTRVLKLKFYYNEMDSPTTILEAIVFLDLFAAGLIVPQLPPQARALGCNYVLVGFMTAVYAAFQFASGPLTGSLSDLKGRKPTLLLTLALSGAAYVLLGLTSSIALFLGLRALLGVFKHTQQLVKSLAPAYIKDENDLSPLYKKLGTWKQAGMTLGPIVGGHIMEMNPDNGFTVLAILVGIIFAINSGLARKLPTNETKENKNEDAPIQEIAPKLVNSVTNHFTVSVEQFKKMNWEIYGDVFALKLLLSLATAVYFSNFTLYLKSNYDASPVAVGYVTSLLTATGAICVYCIEYINGQYAEDNDFSERAKHIFSLLTVALIGMAIAQNISLYVVFVLPLAASIAVGRLVTLEMVLSKTNENQKAAALNVAENLRSLSGVIAPLFVGVVSELLSVTLGIYIAISLAGFGVYRIYKIKEAVSKTAKTK